MIRVRPFPALVLVVLAAIAAPARAQFGGGLSPGQHGDTDLPFGSTDTTDQGWAGYGGPGGSTTKVDQYGKKNWPCYPAGQWAGSKDFHPPKGCPQTGGAAAPTTPAAK
jgi:hypothetical protein